MHQIRVVFLMSICKIKKLLLHKAVSVQPRNPLLCVESLICSFCEKVSPAAAVGFSLEDILYKGCAVWWWSVFSCWKLAELIRIQEVSSTKLYFISAAGLVKQQLFWWFHVIHNKIESHKFFHSQFLGEFRSPKLFWAWLSHEYIRKIFVPPFMPKTDDTHSVIW